MARARLRVTILIICGIINYSAAELTILKQDETFHCIASGDVKASAIAWTKPFNVLNQTTPPSWQISEHDSVDIRRLSQVLTCDLSDEKSCPGWFDPEALQMLPNLEVETKLELGPVLDFRWERFPYYQTNDFEFLHKVTLPDEWRTSHAHLSVITEGKAYLALTGQENLHVTPTYWITIQEKEKHKLWKCPGGIPMKGKGEGTCVEKIIVPVNENVLSQSKWVHLTLQLSSGPDHLNIILRNGNRTLINWNDAAPFAIKYVSYRTQNSNAFWKPHTYNVLQMAPGRLEVQSPKLRVLEHQPLCVSLLYHSGVGQGALRVLREGKVHAQVELPAGTGWQVSRLQTKLSGSTNYKVSIVAPDKPESSFLIGDIRVCSENEFHVSTLQSSKRQENDAECLLLKSGEKIQSKPPNDNNPAFSCLDDTFGSQCNMKCRQVFKNQQTCLGVSACKKNSCSCLAGYMGPTCTTVCLGKYGPGCGHSCSESCKDGRTCDPHSGHCPAGCKDGLQSARCDNWFPKVLNAPYLENISSNSLEITINTTHETSKIFGFNTSEIKLQYKERHETSWRTWTTLPWLEEPSAEATLGDLTDDTTYLVRAVLLNNEGEGYLGEDVPTLTATTATLSHEDLMKLRNSDSPPPTVHAPTHRVLNAAVITLSTLLAVSCAVILVYVVKYSCKAGGDAQSREQQEKLNTNCVYDMQRYSRDTTCKCEANDEDNTYEKLGNVAAYENFLPPALPTRA